MYKCIYVNMHICICVYVYICIYAYMYMCICVYMYMCICVYVYICIYVYIVLSSSNIHCLHALVDIYGDNELSSLSAGSHDSMQVDIGSGGPAEGLSGLGASGFEPSCVDIEKVPLAVAQVGKVNLVLDVAASDS